MKSVSRLLDASQTVRLLPGSMLDGMMKGNMAMPAVPITQASEAPVKASPAAPQRNVAHTKPPIAPTTASAGTVNSHESSR